MNRVTYLVASMLVATVAVTSCQSTPPTDRSAAHTTTSFDRATAEEDRAAWWRVSGPAAEQRSWDGTHLVLEMYVPSECVPSRGRVLTRHGDDWIATHRVRVGEDPVPIDPDDVVAAGPRVPLCEWLDGRNRDESVPPQEVTIKVPEGLSAGARLEIHDNTWLFELVPGGSEFTETVGRALVVRVAYEAGDCQHDQAWLSKRVGAHWDSRWLVREGSVPLRIEVIPTDGCTVSDHAEIVTHTYWLPDDHSLADGEWAIVSPEGEVLAHLM